MKKRMANKINVGVVVIEIPVLDSCADYFNLLSSHCLKSLDLHHQAHRSQLRFAGWPVTAMVSLALTLAAAFFAAVFRTLCFV